jgi:UDP-N-acetylmuramoyl-L-alanyl-D-glutamate--2,6-diaminopimelate ligase
MENVHEVFPREEAITFALSLATPDDTILLSGKGHEDYQEINGVKHHFSDPEHLHAALARLREMR